MQQLMEKLARRGLLWIPPGDGAIPWLHTDDAATAVVAALDKGKPGEVYNVVGDEPASLREYAATLAASLGARPPRSMPPLVAKLAMPYIAAGLQMTLRVSNDKAKRELGWIPRFGTIGAGLAAAKARPAR